MLLYRILISITVILVVFWIWNYVTNCVNLRFCICGTGVGGGSLPAERTGIG